MINPHWPQWLPLRSDLASLQPYGAPQLEIEIRLNTNENPYSLPAPVAEEIKKRLSENISELNRYPDRDAVALRQDLAEYINRKSGVVLDAQAVWVANGSNEILQSLFLACGGPALGFLPSYSMHPLIARTTGVEWINGERNSDFTLDTTRACEQIRASSPRLTFITTPNNPTGTGLSISEIQKLAEAVANVGGLLVVDEAYAEFSDLPSAVTLLDRYPQIVVVRTMSKAFAFAGARVGYLLAHPAVIEAMHLVRLPYHLSSLTQSAARAALSCAEDLLSQVQQIRQSKIEVAEAMKALGLEVLPSEANFLLFTGFGQKSDELWRELLAHGVQIRDVGLAGYLRVTIGTPQENQRFLAALSLCVGK